MKDVFNNQQKLANRIIISAQRMEKITTQSFLTYHLGEREKYDRIDKSLGKIYDRFNDAVLKLEQENVTENSPYNLRILKKAFERTKQPTFEVSAARLEEIDCCLTHERISP